MSAEKGLKMKIQTLAISAILVLGFSAGAQATVLNSPWLNSTGNQETICLAVNLGKLPADITLDLINPFNNQKLSTSHCTNVGGDANDDKECLVFGFTGSFQDWYCRVTTKATKANIRATFAVRNSSDEAMTVVVTAQ